MGDSVRTNSISYIDEWASNDGLTLRVNQGDYLDTWKGVNGTILNRNGNVPKPIAGLLTLNQTGYPQFLNKSIPVNGSVTFCYLIAKSAIKGSRVELFTHGTTFKLNLETSATDSRLSIYLGGVYYTLGTSFIYDGAFHALAVSIDQAGTTKTFIDGAQTGSGTFPAQAIDLTATTSKGLFAYQFSGQVKKFRIYADAVDNPDFSQMPVHSLARVFGFWGQSNMVGSGHVASDFPAYLQAVPATTFESFARFPMQAGVHPVSCGPDLEAIYELTQAYPDDIFYVKTASANKSLYTDFHSPAGTLYITFTDSYMRMVNTLLAEGRTITQRAVIGMQGEEDAKYLNEASAYSQNLTDFTANIFTMTGATVHIYGRIHNHFPLTGTNARPYGYLVRDAQSAGIDTDDLPLKSDFVHYTPAGSITLGGRMATLLIQ